MTAKLVDFVGFPPAEVGTVTGSVAFVVTEMVVVVALEPGGVVFEGGPGGPE